MILLVCRPPLSIIPNTSRDTSNFKNPSFNSKLLGPRTCSFKLCCIENDGTHKPFEVWVINAAGQVLGIGLQGLLIGDTELIILRKNFSALNSDSSYDIGSIWSTMGFYLFSMHIPLSFGGMSVVAETLHQNVLDPETQALSLLAIQTLELIGAFLLLRYTAKPHNNLLSSSEAKEIPKERNWLEASAIGIGFLLILVLLTSLVADRLIGPKDVNNPVLKEILSSGSVSVIACTLAYCIVTPVLEETIYRGFLLTSLSSTMDWQKALIVSSAVFSAAHFSVENSIQLFIIGSVLGCSYCWTGKLSSPILIHSLYNAFTLFITFNS